MLNKKSKNSGLRCTKIASSFVNSFLSPYPFSLLLGLWIFSPRFWDFQSSCMRESMVLFTFIRSIFLCFEQPIIKKKN